MKILKFTDKNKKEVVEQAVATLADGGIVIYPTETCYGIGVDATNQAAVDKLALYKSRREGKPISIAVTDLEMAQKYVEINEVARNLYDNYLPGPITVVSKGLGKVANGVESEYGTLGIRVPDYPLVLQIVEKFEKPVTSTSANVSYKKRPYSITELLEDLPEKQKQLVDLIIDAGELPRNEPSTVVDTTLHNLNVMREGSQKFDEQIRDDKVILQATTKTQEETTDFGSMVMLKFIDSMLEGPFIIALRGELGAGKTQFVKGVARNLKINERISSPTFTIIDEYDYKLGHREGQLVHVDTWRVEGEDELERTGIREYFKAGNIIAIEWADRFYPYFVQLSEERNGTLIKVDFEYKSLEEREIKVYENV